MSELRQNCTLFNVYISLFTSSSLILTLLYVIAPSTHLVIKALSYSDVVLHSSPFIHGIFINNQCLSLAPIGLVQRFPLPPQKKYKAISITSYEMWQYFFLTSEYFFAIG